MMVNPTPQVRVGCRRCFAVLALCAALSPLHAFACPLALSGDVTPAWRDAAAALRGTLSGAVDCERIDLEVNTVGAAHLTFTTRDGRQALRRVQRPEALGPTVRALSVSVPAVSAPAVSAPVRGSDASPAAEPAAGVSAARPPFAMRLGLSVGVRGGDGGLLSPLTRAVLAARLHRVQASLSGAWETQYFDLQHGGSVRDQSAGLVLGLGLGYLIPVDDYELAFGVRLSRATIVPNTVETLEGRAPTGNDGVPFAQWRTGAYASAAFPRQARMRFVATLQANATVAQAYDDPDALSPAWGLAFLLGIEVAL